MGFFGNRTQKHSMKRDLAVLTLRLTTGGLLAGHGAQKLFGSFSGPGIEGTTGMMESMGITPSERWAKLAGLSEFGGGALTALGLFHPLGPIATIGAMGVATRTVHKDKPIWVTSGGAELPVTNIAVAVALSLVDPGRHSLDNMLGIKVPPAMALAAATLVGAGIVTVDTLVSSSNEANGDADAGEAVPA